jgi:hypothetical protein
MIASMQDGRHLTREGLEDYYSAGAPAVIKIEGTPIVYLIIEPKTETISLRTPFRRQSLPDMSAYQHISATTIYWNDSTWCDLRIGGAQWKDAYPMLCAIADRVQLEGFEFGTAVLNALESFRELLSGHARLSLQEEVGLFGELVVLKHLIRRFPLREAVASWRGPDKEEHDFSVGDHDVEVKTTLSEERTHWISHLDQLSPTIERPLWLISIQLTGVNSGGRSLADLVSEIHNLLRHDPVDAEFSSKLSAAKWRTDAALHYTKRFRLRSMPAAFKIGREFPALSAGLLTHAGLDLARFRQIKYLIDLNGFPPTIHTPDFLQNLDSWVQG